MTKRPIQITVVSDANSDECMYVNGRQWPGDTTVYVCDLVDVAKGRPMQLELKIINGVHDDWPKELRHALNVPRM